MLPAVLMASGVALLLLETSRASRGEASSEKMGSDHYGTVHPWMGGRGRHAGSGIASHLGGRSTSPYSWDLPSSTVANWTTGDIFGFTIPFFNIPIGPQARVASLTKRIEGAKEKIAAYEKTLPDVKDDPEAMDRLSTRIAKLEAEIERLQDKRDKIEMRMGAMYGADLSEDLASNVQAVEHLASRVVSAAKRLRKRPDGKKARADMLDLVTSYDAMSGIIAGIRADATGSTAPSFPEEVVQWSYGSDSMDPVVFGAIRSALDASREYSMTRESFPELSVAEDVVLRRRMNLPSKR